MKKISVSLISLSLILCLLFSGCSFRITSVDNLMRPPKLTGENAGIQKAFENAVTIKNVVMKTPTTGEYRSAYVLYDFDNDGEEEAITFYGDSLDNTVAFMHILDKNANGEWMSVADIKGSGNEVYKIDFCDMNADGISEIVVCWSLYESRGNKLMTVYEPDNQEGNFKLHAIATEPFTQTITCDLNHNARDEIFNIIIDNTSDISHTYGRLFKMDETDSIVLEDEVELTPAVSIADLKIEQSDGKNSRLFIDSAVNDSEIVTDVVQWNVEEKSLQSVLMNANATFPPETVRSVKLSSTDIDGDGKIEIPLHKELTGAVTVMGDSDEPLYLTAWMDATEQGLVKKTESLMVYSSSYMFTFPEKWQGTVTVVNDPAERVCIFYAYDAEHQQRGNELFRIVTVPTADFENKSDTYFLLGENTSLTYACKITKTGENQKITQKYIETHFRMIGGKG